MPNFCNLYMAFPFKTDKRNDNNKKKISKLNIIKTKYNLYSTENK